MPFCPFEPLAWFPESRVFRAASRPAPELALPAESVAFRLEPAAFRPDPAAALLPEPAAFRPEPVVVLRADPVLADPVVLRAAPVALPADPVAFAPEPAAFRPEPAAALVLDAEIIARTAALLVPPGAFDALRAFSGYDFMERAAPAKPHRRSVRHRRYRLDRLRLGKEPRRPRCKVRGGPKRAEFRPAVLSRGGRLRRHA